MADASAKANPDLDARQAAIQAHLDAETARDVGRMVATVTPDVAYEFPLSGMRFTGRENARRFYSRALGAGETDALMAALASGRLRPPQITRRWRSDGALVIEAVDYPIVGADGDLASAAIITVIEATAQGVTHERMYTTDTAFRSMTRHVADALEPMPPA